MKLIATILALMSLHAPAYGVDLQHGFNADANVSLLKEIYTRYQTLPGFLLEYDDDKYFSLSIDGSAVGGYDLTDDSNKLSGWPLTRWPHQYYSPDIKAQYAAFSTAEYPLPFDYESVSPGPGCIGNAPLRYGDIEGDGKKEIVVILGGLFIIFSPDYQRIVFSEYLDASDWYTAKEAAELLTGQDPLTNVQYLSRLWADNSNARMPGIRAYAKLYFGDFDNDGNPDILAWRKSYRSNAGSDPVKGFTKLHDSWGHFERDLKTQEESAQGITGEYLPQTTDEAAIKGWLEKDNLTWQKGYPDKSECAGEEGKPILEMSDPLLNDPEVMQ